MRVMELPNWPPSASAHLDPKKSRFAATSDEVVIDRVTGVSGRQVAFICTLEGEPHKYSFSAPDERVAAELKTILEKNKGMTLYSVGTIEIPPEIL